MTFFKEGLNAGGGGGGSTCRFRLKFYTLSVSCRLSFKFLTFVVFSKSQLIFLSLVGNFSFVLSVVSNIFRPFVASRLTHSDPL